MSEEGALATCEYRYLDGPRESSRWASRGGVAVVQFSNGDSFEGHIGSQRVREGLGKYTYAGALDEEGKQGKSASYEGGWKVGKKHGFGVFKYANGDEYEGLWQNGMRNGQGTYRYANGDVFSGEWVNDKKQGHGALVFCKPQSQLVGTWQNNDLVRGKWIHPDMTSFHGSFSRGKPSGKGIMYFSNGLTQQGEFVREAKEGDEEEEGNEEANARRWFVGNNVSDANQSISELVYKSNAPPVNYNPDNSDFVVQTKKKAAPAPAAAARAGAPAVNPQAETDAIERLFMAIDSNGDGAVDLEEISAAIANSEGPEYAILLDSAPQLSKAEFHKFFKEFDLDGSRKLALPELREYFYLLKLFHFVDVDGSGSVRHRELAAALEAHPEAFPSSFSEGGTTRIAISALLSKADSNNDRMLSFPEFVHLSITMLKDEM